MPERKALLQKLSEVSFCVNDLTLYLDTHPTDKSALDLFDKYQQERKQLMEEYETCFEPLTIDCVCTNAPVPENALTNYGDKRHFSWVDGPAPWEGGMI